MWSYLKFLHVVWRYSQPWMSLAANKLQIPFVMNTSSHTRMYICTHRALISDIHTHLRLLSWWFMRLIWLETEKSWLIIQTWMSERLKVDLTSRLSGMSLFAFQRSAVCLFQEPPFDLRRRRMQAGGGKLKLIKHGRWGNLGLILVVWQEEPTNQVFYSILFGKFRVWCCNLHIELFPRSHARPTRIKRATESLQSSAWLPAPIEPGKAMKTAEPRRILRWCADINSTILAMAS